MHQTRSSGTVHCVIQLCVEKRRRGYQRLMRVIVDPRTWTACSGDERTNHEVTASPTQFVKLNVKCLCFRCSGVGYSCQSSFPSSSCIRTSKCVGDGTCTFIMRTNGTICRSAVDVCDQPERYELRKINQIKSIPLRPGYKESHKMRKLRVRSFGVIWIRIRDPRSFGSWCIKRTDESTLVTDSSIPLMYHDPNDLESLILIQITPRERTLSF